MAVRDTFTMTALTGAIAATNSEVVNFYIPRKARLKRLFAAPSASQAAHATQVLDVTLVNEGTDGTGTDTLGVLTNDSDLTDNADGPARESGAWTANVGKEIDFESRPGSPTNAENTAEEIAAGSVLRATVAVATGGTTNQVTVGIELIWSD